MWLARDKGEEIGPIVLKEARLKKECLDPDGHHWVEQVTGSEHWLGELLGHVVPGTKVTGRRRDRGRGLETVPGLENEEDHQSEGTRGQVQVPGTRGTEPLIIHLHGDTVI